MGIEKFKLPRKPSSRAAFRRAHNEYESDLVREAIREAGTTPVQRPERKGEVLDPVMPLNVTTCSNAEIGKLHGQFVAVVQWLEWRLAVYDLEAAKAEAHLKHVFAEVHLEKTGTVDTRRNKALQDERYVREEVQAFKARAVAQLLKARMRGMERCAAALSREVSRRQGVLEIEGRDLG